MSYFWDVVRFVYRWFFRYPVIGGVIAVLIWIVTFDGLASFGIPDLFWRISCLHSFFAGAGIALVFHIGPYVAFLIDSEEFVAHQPARTLATPFWFRGDLLTWYTARTYPLLLLLFGLGLWFHRSPGDFPLATLLGFIANAITLRATRAILMKLAIRMSPVAQPGRIAHKAFRGASAATVHLHVYAALVTGIFVFLYALFAIVKSLYEHIVAPYAIAILLTIILLGYGWPYFRFPKQRLVLPFIALFWILLANALVPYRYRYPTIDYENQAGTAALINDDAALKAWIAKNVASKKLVIVATSGGGIRAALWTNVVLWKLTSDLGNARFSSHIRIITGTSGGMVGAGDFVGSLTESAPLSTRLDKEDSLDPVARALALRDVPKLFIPSSFPDRGVELERRWEALSPALRKTFPELAQGEREGWRPSLIYTPTIVEDGRRLFISNLDLEALTHDAAGNEDSIGAMQLFKRLPGTYRTLHLATAARMSASFPYVSPAAELPLDPRRHLVDAGYWDGYGIAVATAWIRQHANTINENQIDVALIQIRDSPIRETVRNLNDPETNQSLRFFSELIGPLVGAINTIFAGDVYRNEHLIAQLAPIVPGRVAYFTFENDWGGKEPLSWALTVKQRGQINDEYAKKKKEVQKLRDWFGLGQTDSRSHPAWSNKSEAR
jgi:hypothetical protein